VITFRADGDPDADQTRDLVGTLDVVVTQGEAVVVELSAGAPADVSTGVRKQRVGSKTKRPATGSTANPAF
jgi:hypothetical protein